MVGVMGSGLGECDCGVWTDSVIMSRSGARVALRYGSSAY